MTTETELVKELLECRKHLFNLLADLAVENGNEYRAKAWSWLRDYKKWPAERKIPNRGYSVEYGYGWSFSRDAETLESSQKRRPSNLPYDLIDCGFMVNTPDYSEKAALLAAVEGIARLLRRIDKNKEWLEEHKKAEEEALGRTDN